VILRARAVKDMSVTVAVAVTVASATDVTVR
jgi:hypothetical protein